MFSWCRFHTRTAAKAASQACGTVPSQSAKKGAAATAISAESED